ncbi:MAG: enoyl-CoA hydratase-related protein [Candidatus Hodarchaeota archaeon]
MAGPTVVYERKGRICIIRLNRPEKANSFSIEMLNELKTKLIEVQLDDKVRIIILTGTGANFTTGMDVDTIKEYPPEESKTIAAKMERLGAETVRILMGGKLSIAAINGRAMGMGVVYPLACDFRYAVEDAVFKMPEIDASIYPAANCITLMTQQIGAMKTKEILMTCKKYTAKEFKEIGILNDVYPRDCLMEEITALAKNLSRKNKDLLRFLKVNINQVSYLDSFEAGSKLEGDAFHYYKHDDKEKYLEKLVKKYGIDSSVLRSNLDQDLKD